MRQQMQHACGVGFDGFQLFSISCKAANGGGGKVQVLGSFFKIPTSAIESRRHAELHHVVEFKPWIDTTKYQHVDQHLLVHAIAEKAVKINRKPCRPTSISIGMPYQ